MTKEYGYCPQPGQLDFKCGNCGCTAFMSYPQSVPADRSKGWTYEYFCAKCGQIMGLTLEGIDERKPELKPCPFCGTDAKLHTEPTIYGPDKPGWYVQCGSSLCWAQTRSYGVKEQAIRTWNKRVKE